MANLGIGGTFTVSTVEDGQSAPYYFQEWYAWSNVVSTASVTTSPFSQEEEATAWSSSIPENTGGLAYLWCKSIRYVWNENTRSYSAENAQYFRRSGTNGTSISVKGSINYAYSSSGGFPPAWSGLDGNKAIAKGDNRIWKCQVVAPNTYAWVPYSGTVSDGFSYTVGTGNFNGGYQSTSNLTGHLVMWSDEANDWVDLGKFQGANGVTYYTHIAWATNVDSTTNPITVTDFITTKSPNDTTHVWMGVYVDTNSGQDSSKAALYTWSNTKGDGGAVAYVNPEKISVQCDKNGKVVASTSHPLTFSMTVGGEAISVESVSVSSNLPTGVGYRATVGVSVLFVNTEATADGIAEGVTFEVTGFYEDKEFVAYVTVALIGVCQGEDGLSPNVNILLRTIFDDGIDKVREKWSFDSNYVSIDTASDTVVEGRKSIRLNSQNNVNGVGFSQSVLGKIKPNTWYTASFNAFHAAGGSFVMSFYNLIGGSRHLIYDGSVIVDGVARTIAADSCDVVINAAWDGARHTVTFKTRSSEHISTTELNFVFWQGYLQNQQNQTAICMPKLEIGEVATAYMANEDDLRGEKGDQGDRGKIGRFFYFGGTFSEANESQTFIVNDAQAPYFEHTETVTTQSGTTTIKRYHVFNYDTNGTYTMKQMWAISSNWNNKPWEAMTNDFKYLITEAIFARFAKLGSFIVSGDWLISTNGTINGTAYVDGASYNGAPAYTWFDPAYPNTSVNTTHTVNGTTWTGYNFVPNYCVDGRTGTTFQTSGVFSGFIKKKKIVITTDNISEYTKDYSHGSFTYKYIQLEKCGTFIEVGNGVDYTIMMPFFSKRITGMTEEEKDEIRSYIGTKVIIYNKTGTVLGVFLNNSVTASDTKLMNNNTCCCFECVLWSEYVSDGYYEVVKWVVVEDSDGKIV